MFTTRYVQIEVKHYVFHDTICYVKLALLFMVDSKSSQGNLTSFLVLHVFAILVCVIHPQKDRVDLVIFAISSNSAWHSHRSHNGRRIHEQSKRRHKTYLSYFWINVTQLYSSFKQTAGNIYDHYQLHHSSPGKDHVGAWDYKPKHFIRCNRSANSHTSRKLLLNLYLLSIVKTHFIWSGKLMNWIWRSCIIIPGFGN